MQFDTFSSDSRLLTLTLLKRSSSACFECDFGANTICTASLKPTLRKVSQPPIELRSIGVKVHYMTGIRSARVGERTVWTGNVRLRPTMPPPTPPLQQRQKRFLTMPVIRDHMHRSKPQLPTTRTPTRGSFRHRYLPWRHLRDSGLYLPPAPKDGLTGRTGSHIDCNKNIAACRNKPHTK
jgi:hypothetical protein